MHDAKWLGGAFSAYGLADNIRKSRKQTKVSLFTTSDSPTYVEEFLSRAGLGHVKPFKGRWHWTCDDPNEVKQFYMAVGPHLITEKRKMIVGAWEEWRRLVNDDPDGVDPGPIDGDKLYPALHEATADNIEP